MYYLKIIIFIVIINILFFLIILVGIVAQMVERLLSMQEAAGSMPACSIFFFNKINYYSYLYSLKYINIANIASTSFLIIIYFFIDNDAILRALLFVFDINKIIISIIFH